MEETGRVEGREQSEAAAYSSLTFANTLVRSIAWELGIRDLGFQTGPCLHVFKMWIIVNSHRVIIRRFDVGQEGSV